MSVAGGSVSVMMPVRNEGAQLDHVLEAVCGQLCDDLERIVVAVGPSQDETSAVVDAWRRRDPRVVVVDNPEGIVSTGLNRALERIGSTYVVRIDGHCLVPQGYVAGLLETLRATEAACVGPRLRTLGVTRTQRAVAAAMSSPYGVGGARFRTSAEPGYVDTVAFGMYERDRLVQLGGFRPELVRNQDDELNSRLRRDGGAIYLDPRLVVDYYPRGSFRSLWRQYFEYGFWRTVTARRFNDPLRFRQAVPGVFVAALATCMVLAGFGVLLPLAVLLASYSVVLAALAVQTYRRTGDALVAALSGAAGAVLHTAYGAGLWRSLGSRQAWARGP